MKFLVLFLLSQASYAVIPVISSEGVIGQISSDEYSKTLVLMKKGIDQEIVSGINETTDSQWKVDRISVGLGATGEIGLGPYKFGTSIKHRFFYAR